MNVQDDKVIKLVNPFKDHQQHQIDNFSLFLGDSKKCRCCFIKLVNFSGQITIDSQSRQAFFAMTGVNLNTQDSVNFLCINCSEMLRIFTELRKTAEKLQESYNDFLEDIASDIQTEKEGENDGVSGRVLNVDCIVISDDESCTDENEWTSPPQQTINLSGMHDSKITFDDEDAEILKEIMHIFDEIPATDIGEQIAEHNARLTECAARLTRLNPGTIDQYESYSIDGNTKEQTIIRSSAASAKFKKVTISNIEAKQLLEKTNTCDKKTLISPVCGKIIKNKTALYDHLRKTHSPKQNCDLCGKSFSHKASLKDHMYTHHMKVKFGCNLCTAEFRSGRKLVVHKRIVHTKKYKCEKCNVGFGISKRLLEHISVEHEGKRYRCTYPACSKTFVTRKSATVHLNKVHSLKGENSNYYKGKLMLQ